MASNYHSSEVLRGNRCLNSRAPLTLWITSRHGLILSTVVCVIFMRIDLFSTAADDSVCQLNQFRCTDGQCILSGWECDNEEDCDDGSDENATLCATKACNPDYFSCGEGHTCIPESWRCDANEDCPDGFDELNCTSSCKAGEFQCNDTLRCITERWRCDYDNDCTDGSDEIGCAPETCRSDQFVCSNGRCIPQAWHCDRDNDCSDHSDEKDCNITKLPSPPEHRCRGNDFMCESDNRCINMMWKCDNESDCEDGSDEKGCHIQACESSEFRCHNGSCVAASKKCDGHYDCADRSDEVDCDARCDPVTEFDCSGGNGSYCISILKVCDNRTDCHPTGADENKEYCATFRPEIIPDELCRSKSGCDHDCLNKSGVVECRCRPGFKLGNDSKTCLDIDECKDYTGICSQQCENTLGSYRCHCHQGYKKDPKDHRCKAEGDEPRLLFANRHDLRQFGLHTQHYQSLVDQLNSAIALDYDYREKLIYWSDVASEKITRRHMEQNKTDDTVVVNNNLSTPDGLALDWIHKNLYWTDTGKNRIEVQSVGDVTKTWRMVLVSENLDEPRAIVVDPRNDQRYMYWTDWGNTPKIERSNLDGSGRKILLGTENNQSPGLVWPNGLTIDYESNRLFWVDAKLHLIGSSNLEGLDSKIVFTSFHYLKHPFAVTVFEDDIYWSDWEMESILKVSKHNSNRHNHTVIYVTDHLYSPMDVHIYHELKQPSATNACANATCDHLCFPTKQPPYYRCDCSEYHGKFELHPDNSTCIEHSTPSPPSTTPLPPLPNPTSPETSKGPNATPKPDEGSQRDEGENSSGGRTSVYSVLIGVIVVLLLAVVIVVIVYYRYFHIRAPKGLNFDNPVYRRTTEDDQFCIERSTYLQPKALSSLLQPLNSERV